MSENQPTTGSITVNVNVDEMRDLVGVALRRASAFMRLGLDGLEARGEGDFNLTASISYQFWPSEISDEIRIGAREEYRFWLVGSCLRELDLFYGLFLDKMWFAIEVAELHGTRIRTDHVFDGKFSRITNVATKQRRVAKKLGIPEYYDELNSLSLARNSLTHHAGVVRTPVDCNSPSRDVLEIRWLAFDTIASRGGEEQVVEVTPFDTNELPGEGEVKIGIRFSNRQFNVAAGAKIELTQLQLAELCMFYKIMCDKSIDGLRAFQLEKGITAIEPTKV